MHNANVKSKTPLETNFCQWSFDSNICKSACQIGMQMLEADHSRAFPNLPHFAAAFDAMTDIARASRFATIFAAAAANFLK